MQTFLFNKMIQENVVHLILFFNSIKYEDTFTQKTISIKSLYANIKKNAIIYIY